MDYYRAGGRMSWEEWFVEMRRVVEEAPAVSVRDVRRCCLCGGEGELRQVWFGKAWLCPGPHALDGMDKD